MPDYPSAPGRTGYAVGLDVPNSVLAMLHDLREAGYAVEGIPESPKALLDLLEVGEIGTVACKRYRDLPHDPAGRSAGGRQRRVGCSTQEATLQRVTLPSALPPSEMSPSRWLPTAAGPPIAVPTITTRLCRRAMN